MRVVFFLAVWKRPEITELCFMGLQRLMRHRPEVFKSSAFAVISEEEMIPLCERYGIEWLLFDNEPVGMKKNAGLSEILKKDFDYLIELGSDDVILNDLLDVYLPLMEEGADFFATKSLLMVDAVDGACRRMAFDDICVQGLGRCMSRKMLVSFSGKVHVKSSTAIMSEDSLIAEGGTGFLDPRQVEELSAWVSPTGIPVDVHLWDNINRGLDNNSTTRIMKKGYKFREVETTAPLMADIKSDENIWGFNPEVGDPGDLETFLAGLSQQERTKFFANQKVLREKRIEHAASV